MVYHFPLIQNKSFEMWASMCCFHTEAYACTIMLWFQHRATCARKCANCQVWHVNLLWRKCVRSSSAAGWSEVTALVCVGAVLPFAEERNLMQSSRCSMAKALWDAFFCALLKMVENKYFFKKHWWCFLLELLMELRPVSSPLLLSLLREVYTLLFSVSFQKLVVFCKVKICSF